MNKTSSLIIEELCSLMIIFVIFLLYCQVIFLESLDYSGFLECSIIQISQIKQQGCIGVSPDGQFSYYFNYYSCAILKNVIILLCISALEYFYF